jgi:Tfp pilus assembly protein PilF
MSKSSHRKKLLQTLNTPRAGQIAEVRRLVDNGETIQARKRLDALRKSFPDFDPLMGLAWDIEDRCGNHLLATAHAYEWHRATPQSTIALKALCESARSAGFAAIFNCALQRLSALENRSDLQLPEMIASSLGTLSLEQAEAIDLSRMHLADDNPTAAIAVIQVVDHPSARNNLALALFISGDLSQARKVIEANWQDDPNNLFALDCAVRWRCWAEGLERCMGFAAPLKHTKPRRAEDAIAQIIALRFLGDEKAALQAWNNSKNASYWKNVIDRLRETFVKLKDSGGELPGNSSMWFPIEWTRELVALSNIAGHQQKKRWDEVLAKCDAHADYLIRAVDYGDAATRMMALSVLKQRVKRSDSAALASIKVILTHSNGPDSARTDILDWLTEQGLRSTSELTDVWLMDGLRTIHSHTLRITDEPYPSPFPPEGAALNKLMHETIDRGKLRQALDLAKQLHKMYPEKPSALSNLAAIKEGLRYSNAEVTDLYRQAHAMAPDYLFARCGLARCLVRAGKIPEARALIDSLLEREEFHRTEYRSLLITQHAIALASGERDIAKNLKKFITDLENFEENS